MGCKELLDEDQWWIGEIEAHSYVGVDSESPLIHQLVVRFG